MFVACEVGSISASLLTRNSMALFSFADLLKKSFACRPLRDGPQQEQQKKFEQPWSFAESLSQLPPAYKKAGRASGDAKPGTWNLLAHVMKHLFSTRKHVTGCCKFKVTVAASVGNFCLNSSKDIAGGAWTTSGALTGATWPRSASSAVAVGVGCGALFASDTGAKTESKFCKRTRQSGSRQNPNPLKCVNKNLSWVNQKMKKDYPVSSRCAGDPGANAHGSRWGSKGGH